LAPEQAYFVRENLKLRLTAARTALLARQDGPYRADLARAVEIVERNFDERSRQVAAALGTLRTLRDSPGRLELPVLTESLAAVRQLRGRETP
jgi:uroporphyrin-3 C-methyltransferase/uroporphyrinogen III methyltransferase/synthase